MNIVKIMGGLGNQLFGYAFAKHLERCGEVYLDIRWFDSPDNHTDRFPERKFLLDHFTTDFKTISEWPRKSYVDEKFYNPHTGYNNGYFGGYWQKGSFSKDLNLDIRLKDEYITDDMRELARTLESCNTVAVHFRQTDYAQFDNWILDMSYYENAIKKIKELVEDPVFVVFADDEEFGKKCEGRFIHGSELEDFYFMQHCKHNIIANSTYSFWAAMLNKNPDKYVIYPEDWKCGQRPVDFKDERWISI